MSLDINEVNECVHGGPVSQLEGEFPLGIHFYFWIAFKFCSNLALSLSPSFFNLAKALLTLNSR